MATYTGQKPDFPGQCESKSAFHGGRCKKHANKGSNVCGTHGGGAPQVKQAARTRLALLVDPAIEVLNSVLRPGKGRFVQKALQVAVAKDVLDRNGFKAKDDIVITQTFDATRFSHLSDEEVATLVSLARKASKAQDVHSAEGSGESE